VMLPSFLEKEFPSRRGVSAYMELYERVPSPEKESTCFFSYLFIIYLFYSNCTLRCGEEGLS
jgi:hypothetical protein